VKTHAATAAATGNVIDYRVQAVYGRWPWQWPAYLSNMLMSGFGRLLPANFYKDLINLKDAEQHVPAQLDCDWWYGGRHYQKTIAQRPNSGGGFWIHVGGHNYDLSRASFAWNVVESGLASAIKVYLVPALIPYATSIPHMSGEVPYLGVERANLIKALSPVQCLRFVMNKLGGKQATTADLVANGWNASALVAKLGPLALEGIAETALRTGRNLALPSLSQKDPVPSSIDAIDALGALHEDEKAVLAAIAGSHLHGVGSRIDLHHRPVRPPRGSLKDKSGVISDADRYKKF
jgi:hypothetical protein